MSLFSLTIAFNSSLISLLSRKCVLLLRCFYGLRIFYASLPNFIVVISNSAHQRPRIFNVVEKLSRYSFQILLVTVCRVTHLQLIMRFMPRHFDLLVELHQHQSLPLVILRVYQSFLISVYKQSQISA